MLLFLLAFLGGVLTILSPCILPVLPFVFARADRSFLRSGLPMLVGMAITFALVATLAAVGGGWAVQANQAGRWAAMAILGFFGLALLFPRLSDRAMRPLVRLGSRLSNSAEQRDERVGSSLLLGVATGLLWAPCAGPILALILTGAAFEGSAIGKTLLLLAYALGAATSLALALLVGGKVFALMKRSLGAGEWIRRGLGLLVLAGVAAIALGLDKTYLTSISSAQTESIEHGLASRLGMEMPRDSALSEGPGGRLNLPVEGEMPSLDGVTQWLNSDPLTRERLRGRVVLVDFWTYSCINCLRSIPYVIAWDERYRRDGLVVIGVHTPEFAFERDVGNVRSAAADLGIRYPIAIDNDNFAVWRAFSNRFWPAHYFIDAQGRIRYHHFGEGNYELGERVIRQLLAEAGRPPAGAAAPARLEGVGAAASSDRRRSPETYVGYDRAANFASPGGQARGRARDYAGAPLALNQWSLAGRWTVGPQSARLDRPGGRIAYRFRGRDLHLVLGSASGRPIRFRVRLDGRAPGAAAGMDVNAEGLGTVSGQRLYQLVRQPSGVGERLFEIEFLDAGAEAFAFTFG